MENQTESWKKRKFYSSRSNLARKAKPNLKLYGKTLKVYFQVKFLGIILTLNSLSDNTLRRSWAAATPGTTDKRYWPTKNGDLALPHQCKFINNVSNLFLSMALFRQLPPRTISSAKFNGSKTTLLYLPFIYQITSVLSCPMTPLAFYMWRIDSSHVQPSPQIDLHKFL